MTREQAIKYLEDEKTEHINTCEGVFYRTRTEAVDKGIEAIKLIGHLRNRPCQACEFRKEDGCCKWDCVFDEMIYEKE